MCKTGIHRRKASIVHIKYFFVYIPPRQCAKKIPTMICNTVLGKWYTDNEYVLNK